MSILCYLLGHRPADPWECCTLVSRKRRVRVLYRRFCDRCGVRSEWSRNWAPAWVVCVRCGQEGHRSHQCKKGA